MSYDLFALSPDAFERLLQAIALHAVGAGTVIFGDGPDGGREATFEGGIVLSPKKEWSGYTVIQAKAKTKSEGTQKDNTWAVTQLQKELKAFAAASGRRVPEFYIYATNVNLTAVAKRGGRDRCAALLEKAKINLGIKDYLIWDGTQIATYVDAYTDIRRRFREWIVTSDLLEALIAKFGERPADDLVKIVCNYMQKELLSDQYSNLEQIGHEKDRATPLAKVFIDLPADEHQRSEPLPPDEEGAFGLLAELLTVTTSPHLPVAEVTGSTHPRASQDGATASRFVVIGGPGQGKSTLGQFLCQLHRAAFLRNRATSVSPDIAHVCDALQTYLRGRNLCLANLRRAPFRVTLNQFASYLAKSPGESLLSYLAFNVSRRAASNITADQLRVLLREVPSLVVLDGLDEVPASSNRTDVLRAVRDFWIDISDAHADVVAVATTRPQGYHDEFDASRYTVRYLLPLSTGRALDYASSLLHERYPQRPDRREQLDARLVEASRDGAVSRLLRSPLQATIMATLVERMEPPRQRWALFLEYYNVIYRRETERDLPTSKILTRHRQFIDAIHRVVGLRLQRLSERAGSTDALLSEAELLSIADNLLAADEYDSEARARIVEEIRHAATERLVFLVARQENGIGFDIRSLQEFMAGEALVASRPDDEIIPSFEAIAPSAHWRNVLLFATGRVFHEKGYLRDGVLALCNSLNETDFGSAEHELLLGSQLATDLLYEGVARDQPKYVKSLARCALRLLSRPPSISVTRLALSYEDDAELVFREELERGLQQASAWEHTCAWLVLLSLTRRGVPWAADLAARWRTTISDRAAWALVDEHTLQPLADESPVAEQCWAALRRGSPSPSHDAAWVRALPFRGPPTRRLLAQLAADVYGRERPARRVEWNVRIAELSDISLSVNPIAGSRLCAYGEMPDLGSHGEWWSVLVTAVRFATTPTVESLSAAISAARSAASSILSIVKRLAPWPLATVLHNVTSREALAEAAASALRGEFGTHEDWAAAESRLVADGISAGDLQALMELSPIGVAASLRLRGFPPGVGVPWLRRMPIPSEALLMHLGSTIDRPAGLEVARWAGALLGEVDPDVGAVSGLAESPLFLAIVEQSEVVPLSEIVAHLRWFRGSDDEWLNQAKSLGRAAAEFYHFGPRVGGEDEDILALLSQRMDRFGWDPGLSRLIVDLAVDVPASAAPRSPLEVAALRHLPEVVIRGVALAAVLHSDPRNWKQFMAWIAQAWPDVVELVCSVAAESCGDSAGDISRIQMALRIVGQLVPDGAFGLEAAAWNARCRVAQTRAGELALVL